MDLNYLFHRQQVERTRAEAAVSEEARVAHDELAQWYETQIHQATGANFRAPRSTASKARRSKKKMR